MAAPSHFHRLPGYLTERTSGSRYWRSDYLQGDGTKLAAAATAAPSTLPPTPAPPGQSAPAPAVAPVLHYLSTDGANWRGVYGGSITPVPTPAPPGQRTSAGSRYWRSTLPIADGTKLAAAATAAHLYRPARPGQSAISAGSRTGTPLPPAHPNWRRGVRRLIYTSTDSGATWTERTSAGSRSWQSINSTDGTDRRKGGRPAPSTPVPAPRHLDRAHQRRQPLLAVHYLSADGTKLAAGVNGGKSTPYTMASQLTVTG